MNKFYKNSLTVILSLLMGMFFLGCPGGLAEDDNLNRPDLASTGSGIAIRFYLESVDTQYIHLYRQLVTAGGEEPVYDIGLIFPAAMNEKDSTYFYEDVYVIKNQKYRYYVRFNEGEYGEYITNWTEPFVAKNGLDPSLSDSDLLYGTSTSFLQWDSTVKALTVKGSPSIPTAIPEFGKTFTPSLIFSYTNPNDSTKTITQAINFSDTKYSDADSGTLKDNIVLPMMSVLPKELWDKDITVKGIVGQYVEKNENDDVLKVIWTPITPIILKDTTDTIITKFKVPTDYGNSGYNY